MVTWTDVQTTLGRPLTDAQKEQADAWIEQARTIIRGRLGDLDLLDQPTLDMVVTEAVADRTKRPDSATQVTVQVDDGQVSKRYESSAGQIHILDEWWALLSPKTSGGAFTIHPPRPNRYGHAR